MILTVDVGNTNIVFGGFEDDKLVFVSRLATKTEETEDEYATKIQGISKLNTISEKQVQGAIISSVVPPLNAIIKKAIHMVYGVDALIVGPGIKTGINLLVDNPAQVGADLICASVAAHNIYPGNTLILDMGTATKIMAVDTNGTFLGVSIIPGVLIAMNALTNGTAQLPQISLEAPDNVLGKNTVDCMRSGIIYGNTCMIDGMIERILTETGKDMTLIATGGFSGIIIPHCKHSIVQDPHLILKGLNILYKKNK